MYRRFYSSTGKYGSNKAFILEDFTKYIEKKKDKLLKILYRRFCPYVRNYRTEKARILAFSRQHIEKKKKKKKNR